MTAAYPKVQIGALRRAYLEGRWSPVDVVETALARQRQPEQDAVWISTASPDRALARARSLEAQSQAIDSLPLYGVPFSVKDNIDVAGEMTTAACPAFAYRAERSATVVARVEAAGAIYLGKTNLDQFATGLVGVRSPYGIPKNPFHPDAIPGGSSSGAAVSVATGVVGFAFGTDTGGSGRVPASYNGLVGYKPAPGDWSRAGLVYACRSFDTPTVFAHTVDDVFAVDAVLRGSDPDDAFSLDIARAPVMTKPRVAALSPLAIETFGDHEVDALYRAAHERILDALDGRLADANLSAFRSINDLMFFGPFLAERDVAVGAFIDAHPDQCHPVVRDLIRSSRQFSAADAYRAAYQVAEARRATASFWQQHDILITPTVGALVTRAMCDEDPLGPNFNNGCYTNFANPLGLASLSLPMGASSQGIPWGVTLYTLPERINMLSSALPPFMPDV